MANGHFKKIATYARLSESQLVAAMLLFAMRRWALVFSRCPNNLLPITTKETLKTRPVTLTALTLPKRPGRGGIRNRCLPKSAYLAVNPASSRMAGILSSALIAIKCTPWARFL